MTQIKTIVLTGGPCAGKTTALVKVIEHFSSLGFKVFTIPEVPTLFLQAGMDYLTKNEEWFYEGEKATLEIQLALEDKFRKMAATIHQPVLIVCDRGAMDISTYLTPEMWQKITRLANTDNQKLLDRYDAVLHLVSAADGAEQYYTLATNSTRTEGISKARMLDKRIIGAWKDHPYLRVINNHDDFNTKINRVLKEISAVLGLPQPIVNERKYIVKVTGSYPQGSIESHISQTYLTSEPGSEVRVRRRTWEGKEVFIHKLKKILTATEELETERPINKNLYDSMLGQADPYRHTIEKKRNSFIYKGQYFELDEYEGRLDGLVILETKGVTEHEDVKFPPGIEPVEDITGNMSYYNYNMALR